MEFRKREVKPKPDDADVIARKLLGWPDCYYMERDPAVRLALLDAADSQNLTPEDNVFRRKLFEIRYPDFGRRDPQTDVFLRSWMELRFLNNASPGFFNRGYDPKKVRKVLAAMGLTDSLSKGERSLLGEEFYHLGMLYIALCREDKTFNSMILGIGSISETTQARKVAAEFRAVAHETMVKYGVEEEAEIFTRRVFAAYEDMYPDFAGLLDGSEE